MNPSVNFAIDAWSAWAPGVSTTEQWQSYFRNDSDIDTDAKADVSFLPAMQRRRLSPLAKAVFAVINDIIEESEQIPSIFCSTYGESGRTYSILETLGKKEDVSPTAFSLSVHNAISGQFTILFKNKASSTALAPKGEDYMIAIAEAAGMLNEGQESVLVVFYEEALPAFYRPFSRCIEFPCALALRLSKSDAAKTNAQSTGERNPGFALSLNAQEKPYNTSISSQPPLLEMIEQLACGIDDRELGRWNLKQA